MGESGVRLDPSWPGMFEQLLGDWDQASRVILDPSWAATFESAISDQRRLEQQGDWTSGPSSLLGVLGQRHLEERHSLVLAWLLDPRGRHGLGSRLLQRFLAHASPSGELAASPVRVITEVPCTVDGRWGFIDIVVNGPDWVLVIENKLWAGQHGDQLDLYFDAFDRPGAHFMFLTPMGLRARSRRPEVEARWQGLGWRAHVLPWLEELARGDGSHTVHDYIKSLREELG